MNLFKQSRKIVRQKHKKMKSAIKTQTNQITFLQFKSPLSQAWKLFYYDTPLFNFFNNLVNFDYTVNFSHEPETGKVSNST